MTEVTWSFEGPRPLGDEEVQRAVAAALDQGGRPGRTLSVVFLGDEELARMHAEHLDDPSPTDVITFDLGDDEEGPVGELYVSVECAARVALERGVEAREELTLYLVHGALHLCGHDDHEPDERRAMRVAEWEVLTKLGFELDRDVHENA